MDDRRQMINAAGVAAIPAVTSSTPPLPPVPPSGALAVSADPFMAAAADVIAAAIAYIEHPGDTDGEGKDLLFSLESAVMAYRAMERAP